MAAVGFEFGLDFRPQRVEHHLRARAVLEDAYGQAAGAGADEQPVTRDLGLENQFCLEYPVTAHWHPLSLNAHGIFFSCSESKQSEDGNGK